MYMTDLVNNNAANSFFFGIGSGRRTIDTDTDLYIKRVHFTKSVATNNIFFTKDPYNPRDLIARIGRLGDDELHITNFFNSDSGLPKKSAPILQLHNGIMLNIKSRKRHSKKTN